MRLYSPSSSADTISGKEVSVYMRSSRTSVGKLAAALRSVLSFSIKSAAFCSPFSFSASNTEYSDRLFGLSTRIFVRSSSVNPNIGLNSTLASGISCNGLSITLRSDSIIFISRLAKKLSSVSLKAGIPKFLSSSTKIAACVFTPLISMQKSPYCGFLLPCFVDTV